MLKLHYFLNNIYGMTAFDSNMAVPIYTWRCGLLNFNCSVVQPRGRPAWGWHGRIFHPGNKLHPKTPRSLLMGRREGSLCCCVRKSKLTSQFPELSQGCVCCRVREAYLSPGQPLGGEGLPGCFWAVLAGGRSITLLDYGKEEWMASGVPSLPYLTWWLCGLGSKSGFESLIPMLAI